MHCIVDGVVSHTAIPNSHVALYAFIQIDHNAVAAEWPDHAGQGQLHLFATGDVYHTFL